MTRDSVFDFAADQLVNEPGYETRAADLYKAYERWCEANELPAITTQTFAVRLDALGYEKRRGATYSYIGIRLAAGASSASSARTISKQTAMDIALAYREVEAAEALLGDVDKALREGSIPDVRDIFGRPTSGLRLGVPQGHNAHTLFDVPWSLARPIIETHIATQRAKIDTLTSLARAEMDGGQQ